MYTLIFMSSRGDSVRQHPISQGHVLFFFIAISVLCLAAISGLGYGLFQKHRKAVTEKNLQTSMEKSEELLRVKLQIESEFAAIDEEMYSIRQMTKTDSADLGNLRTRWWG